MFDKAVSLTIFFRSIIHSGCSLFIHFLTARRHEGQGGKNLLFTTCVIACLARYHQVTVHTAELPGFHSTPGVGLFSKYMLFQYLTLFPFFLSFSKHMLFQYLTLFPFFFDPFSFSFYAISIPDPFSFSLNSISPPFILFLSKLFITPYKPRIFE